MVERPSPRDITIQDLDTAASLPELEATHAHQPSSLIMTSSLPISPTITTKPPPRPYVSQSRSGSNTSVNSLMSLVSPTSPLSGCKRRNLCRWWEWGMLLGRGLGRDWRICGIYILIRNLVGCIVIIDSASLFQSVLQCCVAAC